MANLRFLDVRGWAQDYYMGGEGRSKTFFVKVYFPHMESPKLPFCGDTFLSAMEYKKL